MHRFQTYKENPADPGCIPFDSVFFDKSRDSRLNAPDGGYGVLYAAQSRAGAFAETFLLNPGKRLISIKNKAYATIRLTADLKMLRFYGPGQPMLGATSQVTSGPLPYDLPQAWSKAIHDSFRHCHGIAYRARHDNNEIAHAIFDRSRYSLRVDQQIGNLDVDWVHALADSYGAGLVP